MMSELRTTVDESTTSGIIAVTSTKIVAGVAKRRMLRAVTEELWLTIGRSMTVGSLQFLPEATRSCSQFWVRNQ